MALPTVPLLVEIVHTECLYTLSTQPAVDLTIVSGWPPNRMLPERPELSSVGGQKQLAGTRMYIFLGMRTSKHSDC